MPEPLTLVRFKELADAYGGVVTRWPEQYHNAAMEIALQPAGRMILEQASALDGALDAWLLLPPAETLRVRVTAGAPMPAAKLMTRARLWWSGVGIAAALAGATAGTAAVAITAPVDAASDGGTSFGDVAGSEI
jgi:hypothetical protein